ncbi:uncharacterized protein LOC134253370 [Saccostrea cucullata]|uniref:uncharacterized protein LOC134253370 n=1 Tax=Saccostrea cuccullata TaxID=36930 RepID=UPI002ED2D22E
MQPYIQFCFVLLGPVLVVSGKECFELQTKEETFFETVPVLKTRTKAVKMGRRYKINVEYYEMFEEKRVQRNVTVNSTKCCQGYQREGDTCILKQVSSILKPAVSEAMRVSSMAVPIIMLVLMFIVSIAIVYRLYSKDKPCKGKSRGKDDTIRSVVDKKDEYYTQIRGLDTGCRQYDDLNGPNRDTAGSRLYEEVKGT